jgi:hypothetical protein
MTARHMAAAIAQLRALFQATVYDLRGGGCIVVILLNVGASGEVPLIAVGEVLGVKTRREWPEP